MLLQKNSYGYSYIELMTGGQILASTVIRIWVHEAMVQDKKELEFPCLGWVQRTKQGSLVLCPEPAGIVYLVRIWSGVNGTADITRLYSQLECHPVAEGHRCHVEQDGLEQDVLREVHWAVVCTSNQPLLVYAHITGQSIEEEHVIFRYTVSGAQIKVPNTTFRFTSDEKPEGVIMDKEVCEIMDKYYQTGM